VQSVLSGAFAMMLAVMVAAFTTELTGLLAGFLYAGDWVTIVHVPMTVAETVFAAMLGTAICLYALSMAKHRSSLALAAGFFLGAASLIKPISQLVVFAFLLGWAAQKKHRATGLIFLLSYVVCVAPWMCRNRQQHGLATLSAIGTVDLYFYVGEASAHPKSITDFSGSELNDEVARINNEWARLPLTSVERKRVMQQKALSLIAQHWQTVGYQSAVGFLRTSFGTGSITVAESMATRPSRTAKALLTVLPLIEVLTLWVLAVLGAYHSNPASNVPFAIRIMLVACIAVVILPGSATLGQSRFRVPAIPALAILGAVGGASLRERRWPSDQTTLIPLPAADSDTSSHPRK
jgi:4-amino-4-deoxy-L-arabinose transferase-like glycosyltransferase